MTITGLAVAVTHLTHKRVKKLSKILKDKGREDLSNLLEEIHTGTNIVSAVSSLDTVSNLKKIQF